MGYCTTAYLCVWDVCSNVSAEDEIGKGLSAEPVVFGIVCDFEVRLGNGAIPMGGALSESLVSLCDSIHVYLGMYRDSSLQKMQM